MGLCSGGIYGESVSQRFLHIWYGSFGCLVCRSDSTSVWISLRGNCSEWSQMFGERMGRGNSGTAYVTILPQSHCFNFRSHTGRDYLLNIPGAWCEAIILICPTTIREHRKWWHCKFNVILEDTLKQKLMFKLSGHIKHIQEGTGRILHQCYSGWIAMMIM